jgi:hypothetical protein
VIANETTRFTGLPSAVQRFDFCAGCRQSTCVHMKYRFTTVVVLLVYLCVSLVIGAVHQHHTQNVRGQRDCAACEWQLNAVMDVPNIVPLISGCVVETPLPIFEFTSYSAPSFSFSPSRAPPAASA